MADRPPELHLRHRLLGVPISVLSLPQVTTIVAGQVRSTGGYIGVCNVHSVITAGRDRDLRHALDNALVNTADGMPLVWALRLLGYRAAERVYGQALMEALLGSSNVSRHFLVGSTDHVQQRLLAHVGERYPGAEIVGRWVPPFTRGVPDLPQSVESEIIKSRPDVVWVALGCPRQEKWMAHHWQSLAPAVLIGVGAAFDFMAGTRSPAPSWMRSLGLEWLFRLGSEPRRLIWRYLSTNPVFIWRMTTQLIRERFKPVERR